MHTILLSQVDDRAALDEFQATQGDDQIGLLRLKGGTYGVMTAETLWENHPDRNTIGLAQVIDAPAALRLAASIMAYIQTAQDGNDSRLKKLWYRFKPSEVCAFLVGDGDAGIMRVAISDINNLGPNVTIGALVPPEFARPWRAEFRKSRRWWGYPDQAQATLLAAALEHWSAQYLAILRQAEHNATAPTADQPHGHANAEGSI